MKNALLNGNSIHFDIGPFTIFLLDDIHQLEDCWLHLQNKSKPTIYQHFLWQRAWYITEGKDFSSSLFIVAFLDNEPAFIIPLIVQNKLGTTLALWPGGEHANYNMGLYNPDIINEIQDYLVDILKKTSRKSIQKIDIFQLEKQPLKWDNISNPMAALPHQKSAFNAASVSLNGDFDSVLKRGNAKRKRKILRAQERALEQLGGYEVKRTQNGKEAVELFKVFQQQKQEWFLKRGIKDKFDTPSTERFFKQLAECDHKMLEGNHLIEFDYIEADGQILSLLAGGTFKGQHFGYFTSMNNDEKYKHISPGALTFYKRIEEACEEGLRRFDFGVGAERYKTSWCDEIHQLFDVNIPVTYKAYPYLYFKSLQNNLKRTIKNNPALWNKFKKLRQALIGRN